MSAILSGGGGVGVCGGGHAWQGVCGKGGMCGGGGVRAGETTTEGGGAHPTGMHSCTSLTLTSFGDH